VSGHAYTVLNVIEYHSEIIIQLRNPWGKSVFRGKYNDPDVDDNMENENLDPELAKMLVKKDPGIFYLCIEEFKKFFSLLSVCYVR
jgi:hypothetical protein